MNDGDNIETRIVRLEETVKILQALVYGVVSLALLTVFGALFTLIIRKS